MDVNGTDCGEMGRNKLVLNESQQDAGFSYCWVANDEQFDKVIVYSASFVHFTNLTLLSLSNLKKIQIRKNLITDKLKSKKTF